MILCATYANLRSVGGRLPSPKAGRNVRFLSKDIHVWPHWSSWVRTTAPCTRPGNKTSWQNIRKFAYRKLVQ